MDWDGRRVVRLVNGTQVDRNIFEDNFRIAVSKENGIVKEYVYGTSVNSPDYVKIDNTIYRIFKDHLGSPRLIVNSADGAIAQRMDYNEWGKVVSDSNPGFQSYGFAGGLYDRSTGFVKFGARDYDPQTGRWTAKDPIRFKAGDTNLYGYVMQDPINWIDPSGLDGIDAILTGTIGTFTTIGGVKIAIGAGRNAGYKTFQGALGVAAGSGAAATGIGLIGLAAIEALNAEEIGLGSDQPPRPDGFRFYEQGPNSCPQLN